MEDLISRAPFLFMVAIILAIRWFVNRMAERNAAREMEEQRRAHEEYADAEWRQQDDRRPAEDDAPVSLEELVRRLQGEPAQPPQPAPARRPAPPPIPPPPRQPQAPPRKPVAKSPPKDPRASLSRAERQALEAIQRGDSGAMAGRRRGGRRGGDSALGGSSIRSLLGSPSDLRKAVILKEVLDAPKALRDS